MEENKKTILIAEDEEDLREMYVRALSVAGFGVLQAANGKESLDFLEIKYPEIDLILMDIVMPGMNGLETLEKIKEDERFKKIHSIVFTNLNNDEDKKQAFDLGADDYLVKSLLTPSELVSKIKLLFSKDEVKMSAKT